MQRSILLQLLLALAIGLGPFLGYGKLTQEATPVATPATPIADTGACDLTSDIPLFVDAGDGVPFGGTVLQLDDGVLTLRCDGTITTIAEGVVSAEAGSWPGAMLLAMSDGSLQGVNLITGARDDLGRAAQFEGSLAAPIFRWLGMPANMESTDWRFVDLETMESLLLSDELGGVLPVPTASRPYAFTNDAAVIGFPGQLVGAPVQASPPPADQAPGAANIQELPFENAALVIDGSLDNTRWTEASHRAMTSAAISPDGELLALEQMREDSLTIRVERLSDGELVAETGIDYGGSDDMALLADSAGLLHLAEDRLDRITWDNELSTETLLEFDPFGGLRTLVPTTDPDVFVVSLSNPPNQSPGYIVNIVTGDAIDIPMPLHTPFFYVSYADGVPPGHVLTAAPHGENGARSTVQMLDGSTGEVAMESAAIDLPPETLATQLAALRGNGTVGFVFLEDGRTVVLDVTAGESSIIAPPEAGNDLEWVLMPSPNGDYLVAWLATGRVLFVQDVSDGEWWEASDGSTVLFVPGTESLRP